ncbi:MAG: NifB/NifX family molybdenum-iron cluster-binding protein [Chloroflexota bacterium]|jgi:predicted Fe-Mo cluster-binding NifX family protein|nr:NifB/NifX family molybdenum-iron cluster-binding protein [Chloroflexota bacterium]
MILIISSQGNKLESPANPRFGRTPWFIRYDTQDGTWQAFENQAVHQRGGAGVAAAQFLIDKGVEAAISGHFGPNAHQALSAGDVNMYTFNDEQQTVQEIIKGFQAGSLERFK